MFLIRHSRLNSTTLHDVPAFFVRSLSTQRRSGNSKQVARKYKGNRRGINWELQRKEFKLCILGRPNAGKSTLFNALVRRNAAIVSNIAGTTRDRREGMGSLGELRFRVIDTGGLEELNKGPTSGFDADNTGLLPSMMAQVEFAMDEADVGLFLLDAKQGVTKDDEFFVKWLRKRQVSEGRKLPIHLLANKAESLGHAFEWGNSDLRWEQFMVDCYRLGFGEPIPMSAEHRQGLGDLYSVLEPYGLMSVEEAMNKTEPLNSFVSPKPIRSTPLIGLVQETTNAVQEIGTSTASLNKVEDESDGEPFGVVHSVSTTSLENSKTTQRVGEIDMSGPIKLALVGRTNVGKSTLFNHLIGKQRVITGPLAGLTRDAIQVEWQYESTKIHLIDTAGMQKQSKLYLAAKKGATQSQRESELPGRLEQSTLEGLSIDKSMNALEMAQIVVVVVELDKTEDDKGREKLQLRSHDLTIMSRIMSEGRGMVIVVNKSDTIVPDNYDDTIGASKYIQEQVEEQLTDAVPLARGVPIIPISALHGDNVSSLMPQVLTVYRKWNAKIPTHKLNKFVAEAQENRSAPQKPMNIRSRRIGPNAKPRMAPVKIKFMNQMYTRPPHFALFTNRLHGESALPPSYISYLTNRLRTEFNLQGIPVRFTVKGSKNPYAGKGLRPERKQSDTGLNTVDGDRSPKRNDQLRRRPQVMKPKRGVGRKLQMAGYRKRFKQGHTNH